MVCTNCIVKKVGFEKMPIFYSKNFFLCFWYWKNYLWVNKDFKLGRNFTEIEKMLSLVQTYGLSHVCANKEFENIDDWSRVAYLTVDHSEPNFNFPYLDIYLSQKNIYRDQFDIMFYLRGSKNIELKFQNLFEFMLFTSLHGKGL